MKNNKNNKLLIKAEQKNIRSSPQKLRLVVKAIKNLPPLQALDYLKFLNKKACQPLAKTIKQAINNAVYNQKINKDDLRFDKIEVGAGPLLKRWRPVSRGRAHPILKRTSHIKISLKIKEQKTKIKDKNAKLKKEGLED